MKPFDVINMAISLLPIILRRPVVCALLRSALSVLQQKHDTIHTTHCGEPWGTYYRLRHTGQVISLESLLNDRFDSTNRRIRVGEGNSHERWWLYTENEINLQPHLRSWLAEGEANTWLYPDTEYADQIGGDFVVSVPTALRDSEASLRVSINDMKIAGVSYVIMYF